jgi:hypothetical protein
VGEKLRLALREDRVGPNDDRGTAGPDAQVALLGEAPDRLGDRVAMDTERLREPAGAQGLPGQPPGTYLREKNLANSITSVDRPEAPLDLRFSQLGPAGLFESLDAAGLLDHRQPGVGPIEPAMTLPPDGGRAHLRGAVIRRHAASSRYVADWLVVRDDASGLALDLRDPFVTEERWRPFPELADLP